MSTGRWTLYRNFFQKKFYQVTESQIISKKAYKLTIRKKVWFAYDSGKLIGAITIEDLGNECELRGFYVEKSYQGKGIGKSLWKKALEFAGKKDIILDTYTHNRTIEIYKKWGFVVDETKGKFFRHWEEWPKGIKAECLYMRYKQNG